ncbi:fumarate hydratase [Arcticibacter sp. MXS-1]|uniref:fumarate hydratase n=1 Tax=Arcticibacter sp. MXS-1 TaxID=3341726 RepID=UPI0035A87DB1
MHASRLLVFTLTIIIIAAVSCRFNPNVQGRGSQEFQGVWNGEPAKFQDSLLQYSRHSFKFTCDSFYATISTRSKINYYGDECFNKGTWVEYAKGTYVRSNDTLYLVGTFTKSDFRQKLAGCYRIGQYLPTFLIKAVTEDEIRLYDIDNQIPLTLKLQKKIICDPQPL